MTEEPLFTSDSNYPLPEDAQHHQRSGLRHTHRGIARKPPGGYTSWQGWFAGKALPLTFFTLPFVIGSIEVPKEAMQLAREGIRLYAVMELLRHSLTQGFLLLLVTAYLTRTHAVATARGFWERIFPLGVLFATSAGISFIGYIAVPQRVDLIVVGLLLTVLGYGVSLWALWHLRGSFAIMAEARSPVMSGPYRYVRHPLYLGETLTLLGLSFMSGTAITLIFWAAVTGMQLTRARVEEMKLAHQFADYRTYRERTRFIIPGLY